MRTGSWRARVRVLAKAIKLTADGVDGDGVTAGAVVGTALTVVDVVSGAWILVDGLPTVDGSRDAAGATC